jgi:putative oxidoreductase
MISNDKKVRLSLLLLRLGVFVVMLMWTLDKFVRPDHAAAVFANFYMLEGLGRGAFLAIGSVQLLIVLGFGAGIFRTWTYGLVLAMHSVSTFSSWKQYLAAFDNLLFFAAWPMLAACITLFLLRKDDSLFSLDAWRAGESGGA